MFDMMFSSGNLRSVGCRKLFSCVEKDDLSVRDVPLSEERV